MDTGEILKLQILVSFSFPLATYMSESSNGNLSGCIAAFSERVYALYFCIFCILDVLEFRVLLTWEEVPSLD